MIPGQAMDEPVAVLLVEDEPAHAEAIRRAMTASALNADVHVASTLAEYRRYVAARVPHIALVDLNLPDGRALDILESPAEAGAFPVLVMTSYGSEQTAVEALRSGALDYVVKTPESFAEMPRSVERALREWRLLQERSRVEKERQVLIEFLYMINASRSREELLSSAATTFQVLSGCEAVGIRIKDGDDFPYFEVRGFEGEFVLMENSLCQRDAAGAILRDTLGNPVHACMCGNVINGRFDPSKPFFTEQGSFWSSNTSELLASTTEEDRQGRTRNRCNGEGYESVALIALRTAGITLGLIQLNDRLQGRFTPEGIAYWERLAGYLAVAVAKFEIEVEMCALNAELEERVRQRTAAFEEVNRELESFSYAVSHDLRAPLRHIEGFANIIQEEFAGDLPPEAQNYFGRIRGAVHKMNGLIDTLLKLSQVNHYKLSPMKVDISAMVREIATELVSDYPDRSVDFDIQPDVMVRGDRRLLQIVMENLLGNAWKYTGQTGEARIEFGVSSDDGRPVYHVRDNGAGFDMRYADKLFEVFQRLHRKDEFEGTGVGLATVRKVLRRMGGHIWAESEVGNGATFYFTVGSEAPAASDGCQPGGR